MTGQEITTMRTLKTWYDNDCIEVVRDNGQVFRMKVKEILAVMGNPEVKFKEVKKRVHTYLEVEDYYPPEDDRGDKPWDY